MTQPNDASRKSPRQFQCRDQLWETFEQMARELECSIDYLINEAMKQYARQRSYGQQTGAGSSRTPFPGARDTGQIDAPPPMQQRPPLPPTAPAVPMPRPSSSGAPTAPPPPMGGRLPPPPPPPPGGRLPPPPPPATGRHAPAAAPPPVSRGPMGGPPPLPRGSLPPQIPQQQQHHMPPPQQQQMPPPMAAPMMQPQFLGGLTAIYQGERTSVNKEKFIIGRGRQTSDLTIKDPNVSRQHAMVEFQNGVYYMVDLGSTNGVEYQGQRVTRKAIAEGDTFRICDHEVVFTYR
jgi:pSer/pThr/pTyr-binding forkhead associated (FHA) protein